MIKQLLPKLKFPNFDVSILFEEAEDHEFFGKVYSNEYKVVLSNKNLKFNKYLYLSFMNYMINAAYNLNISDTKSYSLGAFFYHILEYNSIVTDAMPRIHNTKGFKPFKLKVPTFNYITVVSHDDEKAPLGSAVISNCEIRIFNDCKHGLKDVILIHELVEFCNSIYRLKLKHSDIQTFSEILTFVLNKNKGLAT